MTTTHVAPTPAETVGSLQVVPFAHPQGCRTYLVADPASKQAMAIDVHLDLVEDVRKRVAKEGWTLPYVVDTHTHADHPSGAGGLAPHFGSTRIAHEVAGHAGVARHPKDGDTLHLGDQVVAVHHAPGHTPDHLVMVTDGALFSGDTLMIGGVARTDFLGGDAGQLYDSIHRFLADLADDIVVYPGHDYQGRIQSSVGTERQSNPWLHMSREDFVRELTANPPPRPANMDDLLRLNKAGVEIPESISTTSTLAHLDAGGATTIIDVRTGAEYDSEHVPGSRLIPLDQLQDRADEVRATPAPRLLLCRTGSRAAMARKTLSELDIGGLTVIDGGIEALSAAGAKTEKGAARMSLERQVRIGAGAIVVLAVALGAFVHPGFLALAAFVGAGQVFAGVTDWCGMGLLLAKAPWNQSTSASAVGAASACAAAPPSCAASAPSTGGCAAPTPKNAP